MDNNLLNFCIISILFIIHIFRILRLLSNTYLLAYSFIYFLYFIMIGLDISNIICDIKFFRSIQSDALTSD